MSAGDQGLTMNGFAVAVKVYNLRTPYICVTHFTLYSVQYVDYTVYITYSVQYTVYLVHCKVYVCEHYAGYSVYCICITQLEWSGNIS